MDKVLTFAKKLLKNKIDKNSIVVDATCGNGLDTLFLAKSSAKKVYAFDIQQQAITNTKKLLNDHNVIDKCNFILASHEQFDNYIAEKINAVIFNLGYLPNADHTVTTIGEVTKKTIEKMLAKLEINGIIVVVVYWGHENGKVEKELLEQYFNKLDQAKVEVLRYEFVNQKNNAPFLFALEKIKEI